MNDILGLEIKYAKLLEENKRLKKELEDGKTRWKYFESRFVKCNTCTPDQKIKMLDVY